MKVKVIGSGSMWTKYNSACYLVDEDIMVDFPNGTCKYLYRQNIEPKTINHVILTHFHGDHYFDMPFYILNKFKSENKKINVYCSPEGENKITAICKLAFPYSFQEVFEKKYIKFINDDTFTIKDYKITKLLVEHGNMKPAYGYIFQKDNISFGFTGDTALCQNVEIMAQKCKYLFCDCMLLKGHKKHQGIDNLEYLSTKYQNCTFIVSHLEDETRDKLKELNISNIIVPEDYQTIIIEK